MPSNFKIPSFKFKIPGFVTGLCFFLIGISANAQCAMCRAALESEGNKTKVEAVNDGIVFLMAIPYILVAIIGFVVYKMYSKKSKAEKADS